MKLEELLKVLTAKTYVLDFYDGNVKGISKDEVTVTREAASGYEGYAVHVIHEVTWDTAIITLKSRDYS